VQEQARELKAKGVLVVNHQGMTEAECLLRDSYSVENNPVNDREHSRQPHGKEQARTDPAVLSLTELGADHGDNGGSSKNTDKRDIHDLPSFVTVKT